MTTSAEVGGAAAAGMPPMEDVDAALRAAVAGAVTTEGMMQQAARLSVAPATGKLAMSPLQLSMERHW